MSEDTYGFGPRTRRLPSAEVDLIKNMLKHSGQLFLLLDSGVDADWTFLLAEWGCEAGDDKCLMEKQALTGNGAGESIRPSPDYRPHAKPVRFNLPRSIQPLLDTNAPSNRPQSNHLASTSERGWADTSAYRTRQGDAETDQRGPIPVAMAVETNARKISTWN